MQMILILFAYFIREHVGFFGINFAIDNIVSLSGNSILNKVRFKPACYRFADLQLIVDQMKWKQLPIFSKNFLQINFAKSSMVFPLQLKRK